MYTVLLPLGDNPIAINKYIILAVFSCHILISPSFQVSILLKLFGDVAMKVVTVRNCYPY